MKNARRDGGRVERAHLFNFAFHFSHFPVLLQACTIAAAAVVIVVVSFSFFLISPASHFRVSFCTRARWPQSAGWLAGCWLFRVF